MPALSEFGLESNFDIFLLSLTDKPILLSDLCCQILTLPRLMDKWVMLPSLRHWPMEMLPELPEERTSREICVALSQLCWYDTILFASR
jgi:hypothetical protein